MQKQTHHLEAIPSLEVPIVSFAAFVTMLNKCVYGLQGWQWHAVCRSYYFHALEAVSTEDFLWWLFYQVCTTSMLISIMIGSVELAVEAAVSVIGTQWRSCAYFGENGVHSRRVRYLSFLRQSFTT